MALNFPAPIVFVNGYVYIWFELKVNIETTPQAIAERKKSQHPDLPVHGRQGFFFPGVFRFATAPFLTSFAFLPLPSFAGLKAGNEIKS